MIATSLLCRHPFKFDSLFEQKSKLLFVVFCLRDPRLKRMQKAEEEKATTNKLRDGAKLSFKEKMQLFASEAGENAPRDKAKISKAQRNIEGEEPERRD